MQSSIYKTALSDFQKEIEEIANIRLELARRERDAINALKFDLDIQDKSWWKPNDYMEDMQKDPG